MERFIVFVSGIILGALTTLAQAYFATMMWNWYIPNYFGLKPIKYEVMCGIILMITCVRAWGADDSKATGTLDDIPQVVDTITKQILVTMVITGMGWVFAKLGGLI